MKCTTLFACLCLTVPVSLAVAEQHDSGTLAQTAAEPVNTMCPIGKEPIVPAAGTVEHKGNAIGLCCPGCGKQFLAWDDARKDEFVAMALAGREPGAKQHDQVAAPSATAEAAQAPSYPYTLPDCPVGGPLGSMGDPIVKVYDNREVRFCCASCIDRFEGDKARYWGEIDRKLVEQQLRHYPIDTCIVTGATLGADAVNHVHNNRLVRLANADAVAEFKADPKKHLDALDKRIIEAQLPGYPLKNCPVGGPLGSMGEPVNFIIMNRLVRLCCESCRPKFEKDPLKYLSRLPQE